MKNLLICPVSTRTVIGDESINICNLTGCDIVKTDVYSDDELINKDIVKYNIKLNKERKSIINLMLELYKLWFFLINSNYNKIVIYSANPIYYIFSTLKNTEVWLHDPTPHSGVGYIERWVKFTFEKIFVKNIIVSSETLKKEVDGKYNSIRVIRLPFVEQLVSKVNIHERDIDLLFFGRIEKYKGLDFLADIIEDMNNFLYSDGKKIKVMIVGKGDVPNKLKQHFENVEVTILNEYIPNESLSLFINRAKVSVFPYSDSTGTQTIQTALVNGCKVVSTKVGSFPEYLSYIDNTYYRLISYGRVKESSHIIMDLINDESDVELLINKSRSIYSPIKSWGRIFNE